MLRTQPPYSERSLAVVRADGRSGGEMHIFVKQPGPLSVLLRQTLPRQPLQHNRLGVVPNVHADPLAPEALGRDKSRGASAEGVQHHVAGVTAGEYDALQQGEGLLCRIPRAFFRMSADWSDIGNNVLNLDTRTFIKVSFLLWNAATLWPVDSIRLHQAFLTSLVWCVHENWFHAGKRVQCRLWNSPVAA